MQRQLRLDSASLAGDTALPDTFLLDTLVTLEYAIELGARFVQVDSGSAEDQLLDSLMLVAGTLSENYRRYVMSHTHRSLAAQAHQDPAKQRRLLMAIYQSREKRELALLQASEERRRRIAERIKALEDQ